MNPSASPSVISFRTREFLSQGQASVVSRGRALQAMVQRALAETTGVSIQVTADDGESQLQRDILVALQELLTDVAANVNSTIQGDRLILSSQPLEISLEHIRRNLHEHAGGLIQKPQTILERNDHCWDEHLLYADARLREKKEQERSTFSPRRANELLRGRSAEFILQMVLESYAQTFSVHGFERARLIDRKHPINLPFAGSGREYSTNYTTFHNVEINVREAIHNRSMRQRNNPFLRSDRRLTEVDAVVATGFGRDQHSAKFNRLFFFDATTDEYQLGVKSVAKMTRLADLIGDMRECGIDVQLINVLMANHSRPIRMRDHIPAQPGNVHNIVLPLADQVAALTMRTAKELNEEIPEYN